MTAYDIRPYDAPQGGVDFTSSFPLTASASFSEGEPVVLAAAGGIGECTDDPATVTGVSAVRSTDADGTVRATGTLISVIIPVDSQRFSCQNFATDGAGTLTTPTQANAIGESAGLSLTGVQWSVDTGTGNLIVEIDDVVDIHGFSINDPQHVPGTANAVIFRFI